MRYYKFCFEVFDRVRLRKKLSNRVYRIRSLVRKGTQHYLLIFESIPGGNLNEVFCYPATANGYLTSAKEVWSTKFIDSVEPDYILHKAMNHVLHADVVLWAVLDE